MSEEIIIDGVDVSECRFLDEYEHCAICKELIKTKEGRTHCFTVEDISCEFYPYCHYKQLKRLEFENKLLKADYEASEEENAKLKEAFKKAKEVIAYCYDEEKPFTSCIDCKYYDGCKIQPVDYALRIIDEVLKDE